MTNTIVRCRFDHTAADAGGNELRSPQGQLVAWSVSEVAAVIAEAEAAARRGWYAAGFVSYEAAPAFDDAFRTKAAPEHDRTTNHLPLAWFGLFAECEAVEVPAEGEGSATTPGAETWSESPAWRCDLDAPGHAASVAAIRRSIADGDAYLVNLTTRFRRPLGDSDHPFSLYRRLVAAHSGGYHMYLETTDWAVVCGSPELFFDFRDGRLATRPMKGTAPRGRWTAEDTDRASALCASSKERAENVMVVDMLRNDMGRIATTGSVDVPHLGQLERHPTLWQLTSTVTARTRQEIGLAEVFGALFPCASVTGTPKVSAMGIIADLEGSPRGIYCGAVGIVRPDRQEGPDGVAACFAVAIRTAVVDTTQHVVEYGSGGGITWDSVPAAEWEEVLIKANALVNGNRPTAIGHGLIETMGFNPLSGTVRNLEDHLARLAASAQYLGRPAPADAEERISKAIADLTTPTRLRLVLNPDGTLELTTSAIEGGDHAQWLCVDSEPIASTDVALFHKLTDRRRYDERMGRHPEADDVILVNERGEVTETTRANLAVSMGGRWCTPPLNCGLLPGIERARLLRTGHLVEQVITVEELGRAEAVATLSSLRGWRTARLRPFCGN